MQITVSGCY